VSYALVKFYILGLLFETYYFCVPRAIGGLSTNKDSYFVFSPSTAEELLQGTVLLLTWHAIGFSDSLYFFTINTNNTLNGL
jgi:hypothetical protein